MDCHGCNRSLAGQKYVKQEDKPYCMNCFETKLANKCCKCEKVIGIDSRDLVHDDKHWHAECFTCIDCGCSLASKAFIRKEAGLACADCKDDGSKPQSCSGCKKDFAQGEKRFNYKGDQYHPECFTCVVCKKPIGQQSFMPRGNGYVCSPCFDSKLADKCAKCNETILADGVTYKDQPFHPGCFTCTLCDKRLAGEKFTSQDDKPYCADCYVKLFAKSCNGCGNAISGFGGEQFVTFEDKQWHPGCFNCGKCATSLAGKGFMQKEGMVLCGACA